ncbi:hypothetical protein D3C85_1405010 [compost metagenome]
MGLLQLQAAIHHHQHRADEAEGPGQQMMQAQGMTRQQQWGEQYDAQGPEVVDEVRLQHGGVAKAHEQQQVIEQQGRDGHQPGEGAGAPLAPERQGARAAEEEHQSHQHQR